VPLRSTLLTLGDAGSGTQRPRDDDESVIISSGRFSQHGGDGITRPSRDGQHEVAAAGRIDMKTERGEDFRQQSLCDSLLQVADEVGWTEPLYARHRLSTSNSQFVGDEGSRWWQYSWWSRG
jgi:hypothetical protein